MTVRPEVSNPARPGSVGTRKGQASFMASDGRGKIEVKFAGEGIFGDSKVTAKVGNGPEETFNHFFSPDSNIFKIPTEFDFKNAGEKTIRLVVSVRSI